MEPESPFDKERAYSWYPGHMHKAQKRMALDIRKVDVVLEFRDARMPFSSGNSELVEIAEKKLRLLIFNKAALSDPGMNKRWEAFFREQGVTTLFMDAASRSGLNQILPPLKLLCAGAIEKFTRRGIRPPPQRLMIIGMPNVGKSTFINRLVRKNRLKTTHTPGTTRGTSWVPLRDDFLLMDTPGVMLPRMETEADAQKLAWIAAIPDGVLGAIRVAEALIREIITFPLGLEQIKTAYHLENLDDQEAHGILDAICLKRGLKSTGNQPDQVRAAEMFLKDFREGRIGRYTFETPPDKRR